MSLCMDDVQSQTLAQLSVAQEQKGLMGSKAAASISLGAHGFVLSQQTMVWLNPVVLTRSTYQGSLHFVCVIVKR